MDTAVLMEIEKPAPGKSGGSAREVSGGVSGRDAMPAPGASVPADRLAAAGFGRRRSLANARAQRRGEIAQDADLRIVAPRDFFTVGGERIETTSGDRDRPATGSPPAAAGHVAQPEMERTDHSGRSAAKGFRYENQHYSSLSAIASRSPARAGTAWPSSG